MEAASRPVLEPLSDLPVEEPFEGGLNTPPPSASAYASPGAAASSPDSLRVPQSDTVVSGAALDELLDPESLLGPPPPLADTRVTSGSEASSAATPADTSLNPDDLLNADLLSALEPQSGLLQARTAAPAPAAGTPKPAEPELELTLLPDDPIVSPDAEAAAAQSQAAKPITPATPTIPDKPATAAATRKATAAPTPPAAAAMAAAQNAVAARSASAAAPAKPSSGKSAAPASKPPSATKPGPKAAQTGKPVSPAPADTGTPVPAPTASVEPAPAAEALTWAPIPVEPPPASPAASAAPMASASVPPAPAATAPASVVVAPAPQTTAPVPTAVTPAVAAVTPAPPIIAPAPVPTAHATQPASTVPVSPPMDRDFIARNQIVERYLSGRLPLKGATDFERFCKENPDLLDALGLPERVNAGLRLLEASGKPEPWQEAPQPFWMKLPVIAGLAAVALVLSIALPIVGTQSVGKSDKIAKLQKQIAAQPLDAATATQTFRVLPNRDRATNTPVVTIGGGPAILADFKIDESRSEYKVFTITLDRVDQGRVGVIHNLTKDSNGNLRMVLNSSALGPGIYQFTIQGMSWRGEAEPDSWLTIGITR